MKFSKILTLLLQSLVDLKFQTFHTRALQENVAEEEEKSCKRSHPIFFILLISLYLLISMLKIRHSLGLGPRLSPYFFLLVQALAKLCSFQVVAWNQFLAR